jgi:hypothetical protein
VSDQDSSTRLTEDEDVEAHGRKKIMASDEAPKDEESDEDVELHGRKKVMASTEATKDDESDDDVELHGSTRSKIK